MISLAMIVKNEAARLLACLASAAPAVDEIVVVDTGSTDGTPALARSQGARVVEWAWRDDFAAARNEALALAREPWILVLDADERLAPGAAERVRALAATGKADGFNCRLVSRLPADQPSPVIAHWYCRLFRKRDGVRYEGRVHEQIAPSLVAHGGRIVASDVTILHDGYATASPAKLARNLALLRTMLAEQPDDAFAVFNLGMTLLEAGDRLEARRALEQALGMTTRPLSAYLTGIAWMKLAELYLADNACAAAAAAANQALAVEPDLALARFVLGHASLQEGDVAAATRAFDELAEGGPDALGLTLQPRLIAIGRALVRLRRRQCVEAAGLLESVIDDDPTGEVRLHLGNTYLALGRLADAAAAYHGARARGIDDPSLERRLALCQRLAGATGLAGAGRS